MAVITDKGMQAKPIGKDQWLNQPFKRGAGVFSGRITAGGERLFYFRYSGPNGQRTYLPIGPYHPRGSGGLTLAQAFQRASELSLLYQSGVRDLREHFERERQALELAEQTAEAERRHALHAAERAAQEAQRRVTVRTLFEQWQRAELRPQPLADGTRTGRKDGGEWVRQSFERRVFPVLGDVAAEDVRRADLLKILDDCKAEGRRRTANVLLTDLRQMIGSSTGGAACRASASRAALSSSMSSSASSIGCSSSARRSCSMAASASCCALALLSALALRVSSKHSGRRQISGTMKSPTMRSSSSRSRPMTDTRQASSGKALPGTLTVVGGPSTSTIRPACAGSTRRSCASVPT